MISNKRFWAAGALPLALALLGATCAYAQTAPAQIPSPAPNATPVQQVDALNAVFGAHPGFRPVHAKGIILKGVFTPKASAASISKAAHLQKKKVPVTVRFSNFAGIPDLADTNGLASPHGLAIRFDLPKGAHTDIVAHSFNGFPSPTADDFHQLLLALAASGPDAAKPTQLDAYLGNHPVAKAFLTAPKPAPASYGTISYFGVNTFKFTNANGVATLGRYQIVPVAGNHALADAQAAKASPTYLATEIRNRVKKAPVKFKILVQIADKDDKVDDPSIAWPDSRRTVELGILEVTRTIANSDVAQKKIVFMPNALTAGIDVEDPMIDQRSAIYAVSFGRRSK